MPFVDWQLSFCHAITGVCTPACLLAASISVEAVTPPLVGMAFKEQNNRALKARFHIFQSRGQPSGSQTYH